MSASSSALMKLKIDLKEALQHQRLIDGGIFDVNSHELAAMQFRRDVSALLDMLFSGRLQMDVLHPSCKLILPNICIDSLQNINNYFKDIFLLKYETNASVFTTSNSLLVLEDKVIRTKKLKSFNYVIC
jgi:hypothetical protein